jgi:hypothetical protein
VAHEVPDWSAPTSRNHRLSSAVGPFPGGPESIMTFPSHHLSRLLRPHTLTLLAKRFPPISVIAATLPIAPKSRTHAWHAQSLLARRPLVSALQLSVRTDASPHHGASEAALDDSALIHPSTPAPAGGRLDTSLLHARVETRPRKRLSTALSAPVSRPATSRRVRHKESKKKKNPPAQRCCLTSASTGATRRTRPARCPTNTSGRRRRCTNTRSRRSTSCPGRR